MECSPESFEWVDKINKMIELAGAHGRIRYVFPPSCNDKWEDCMAEIKHILRLSGNVVSVGIYVKRMQCCGYQDFLDIAWKPTLTDRYHQWKDLWFNSVKYE